MGMLVVCLLPYIPGPRWITQYLVFVNLFGNLLGT